MSSYVVVAGTVQSTGSDTVEAVVVSRGTTVTVLGTSAVASDLREVAERPDADLDTITAGMGYHLISGPHVFDSDDVDALAAVYGLTPR